MVCQKWTLCINLTYVFWVFLKIFWSKLPVVFSSIFINQTQKSIISQIELQINIHNYLNDTINIPYSKTEKWIKDSNVLFLLILVMYSVLKQYCYRSLQLFKKIYRGWRRKKEEEEDTEAEESLCQKQRKDNNNNKFSI